MSKVSEKSGVVDEEASELDVTVKVDKLYIIDSAGCDFCSNKICDDPVMILCADCRKYMNSKMRRQLLIKDLDVHGLKLRDDSILVKKYIHGDKDTKLVDVVNNHIEMYFYIHRTTYLELIYGLTAYYCNERGLEIGSRIDNKEDMNEIKKHCKRIALDRYVRTGKDLEMVPVTLANMAEIIALEK